MTAEEHAIVYTPDEAGYYKHLREDFRFFLKEVWRLIPPPVLPEPHWVQYDIAHWLQHGPRYRGVRGTRKLSKTWTTCAYSLWRLFCNPLGEQVVLCSATPDNSKKSLHMMRIWIDYIPFLQHLAPRDDSRWLDSAEKFDVGPRIPTRDPSVTAMGILGALPGTRSTVLIADDIEQDNNTQTRAARVLLDSRAEEFVHISLEGGDIVYLGTDHHEESLYEKLEAKGYEFRAWPIRYPDEKDAKRTPGLAPSIAQRLANGTNKPGDPVWPKRWDNAEIAKLELGGQHSFKMQCLLIRGLANEELYPLKLSDLIVFDAMHRDQAPATVAWGKDTSRGPTAIENIPSVGFGIDQFYGPIMVDERWLPYQGCKAFLDPAGKGTDEMAWAIVAQLHGYLYWKYVMGVGGKDAAPEQRGATQANLERIVLSLREHDARELWVETNFGGEYLIPLLEPIIRKHCIRPGESDKFPRGWSCAVQGKPSTGMKEGRIIDDLESTMRSHRLVVSRQVASDHKTMYQMTRMKRERNCLDHEDRAEAGSGACSLYKDFLHQDTYTTELQHKRRQQEELLKKHRRRHNLPAKPLVWNPH